MTNHQPKPEFSIGNPTGNEPLITTEQVAQMDMSAINLMHKCWSMDISHPDYVKLANKAAKHVYPFESYKMFCDAMEYDHKLNETNANLMY